jgi:hypothetical protein
VLGAGGTLRATAPRRKENSKVLAAKSEVFFDRSAEVLYGLQTRTTSKLDAVPSSPPMSM